MKASRAAWAVVLMAVTLLTSFSGRSAQAQTNPVYRCGNVYTQFPCAQDARALALDGPPEASARQHGARTAASEARWAERMRVERLADEARARPAQAVALGQAPLVAAKPSLARRTARHASGPSRRGVQDAEFTAYVPAPPKPRKTLR